LFYRSVDMNLLLLAAFTALLPVQPVAIEAFPAGVSRESVLQTGITVTVLFDNYPAVEGFRTGWGYSALLESPGHTLLFDTGADGEALLENFRLLGKDPLDIETIVISHAHGDHTGGLQALLNLGLRPTIVLLSGFPAAPEDWLPDGVAILEAEPGQEIHPGIRTTGQMGTDIPEQALILDTAEGTVVLTGCAHPGVIQMVERARELQPGPLYMVAGGFHIMNASPEEIQGILAQFQRLGVERAGPTHCSGEAAMEAFREAYGENFQPLGAGRVFTLPLKSGF
jgi:7,8-dihydropterin-6-yl-methyl-4-(beta-D-ribofuranosyl)aminobenzene 5'-phosphate synthase